MPVEPLWTPSIHSNRKTITRKTKSRNQNKNDRFSSICVVPNCFAPHVFLIDYFIIPQKCFVSSENFSLFSRLSSLPPYIYIIIIILVCFDLFIERALTIAKDYTAAFYAHTHTHTYII
jgi:hypothetical protein